MAQENLLKIFWHTRSHNTTYGIVNLEDTTDVTLSGVVNQNKNPPQPHPTFYPMIWRLKGYRMERLSIHLLVDEMECFILLNNVKIFFFGNLQEVNLLFYFLMNLTHVMIVYSWIKNIMINYVFSIKLIQIPIYSSICF